jgi:hypothetical protein
MDLLYVACTTVQRWAKSKLQRKLCAAVSALRFSCWCSERGCLEKRLVTRDMLQLECRNLVFYKFSILMPHVKKRGGGGIDLCSFGSVCLDL